MKMRKLCISLCVALGLVACSSDLEQDVSKIPAAQLGAVVSSIDTNPYFQSMYKSFQDTAAENSQLNLQLEASKDDQELQNNQIEAMINSGAKALVINLADTKVGPELAMKMCDRRIPVVYINRTPGNKTLQECDIAYFVGSDDYQAGILQAQLALENWTEHPEWDKNGDGKMQLAILEGNPAIHSARIRANWAISSLKFNPENGLGSEGIDIVLQETGRYSLDVAKEVVGKWINSPDFNKVEVILAGNDNMALGAAEILEANNKKLPIFGIDGLPKTQDAIKHGRVFATILNDADTQARVALRMAANLANERPVNEGVFLDMDESGTVSVPLRRLDDQPAQSN